MIKKLTKKFMLDLADRIYNPKTKEFMRLCIGTLENGPDPTNAKRVMHCGLGELYFAMTGKQPRSKDHVTESDVVKLAARLAGFGKHTEKLNADLAKIVRTSLKGKGIPQSVQHQILANLPEATNANNEYNFFYLIDNIPNENDDGCNGGECTLNEYKARSRRVANVLRKAAKYIPE